MSDERKAVHMEEYLKAHVEALRQHPAYRPDMKITVGSAQGALVFHTRDKVLAPEDREVFEEVGRRVERSHRLVVP